MADPPAARVGDRAFTSGPLSRQLPQATRPEGAEADADFAARRLREGAPPAEVEERLTGRGLNRSTAAAIVRERWAVAVYSVAAASLRDGESPTQAVQRLVDKGLEQRVASAVINDLLARGRERVRASDETPPVLVVLGGLLLLVGAALFMGNMTGLFPTFPFAGFLLMGIGATLFRAGH
jgi:hypothetical protein